jgi:hypothetical protein
MGVKIGEKGLDLYAPPRRLKNIRNRIRKNGAIPLAAFDLVPPPFPFTCSCWLPGRSVKASTFFITLGLCRLLRFVRRHGSPSSTGADSRVVGLRPLPTSSRRRSCWPSR